MRSSPWTPLGDLAPRAHRLLPTPLAVTQSLVDPLEQKTETSKSKALKGV